MYQNMTSSTVHSAASSDDGCASSTSGPKPGCRTKYCLEFKREGVCSYGDQCRYAHDITDLDLPVPAPPNYEKVPCRTYSVYGTCPYGIHCQFAHVKEDTEEILSTSNQCNAFFQKMPLTPPLTLEAEAREAAQRRFPIEFYKENWSKTASDFASDYGVGGDEAGSEAPPESEARCPVSNQVIQSQPTPTKSSTSCDLSADLRQYFKKPSMLDGAHCPTYSAMKYCLLGDSCMFVHQEKPTSACSANEPSSEVSNSSQTYINSRSSSPSWPNFGYDDPANPNAAKTIYPPSSHAKRSLTSDDSSLGSSIDIISDSEIMSATPEPEPVPTHEIWPLKPEDVLRMSKLSVRGGSSSENISKKYPSSLIAIKPIYDEWQRVQKEPWGKPKKRSDGGFDPFFY